MPDDPKPPVAAAPATPPVVPPVVPPVTPPVTPPVVPPVVPPVEAPVSPPVVPPVAAPVTLTIPKDSKLSVTDVEEVTKLATDMGLTQPQAQAILDQRDAGMRQTVASIQTNFAKEQAAWQAAIAADPELGGAPDVFTANAEHWKLGLQQLMKPEELAAIEKAGFGNAPWLCRMGLRHWNVAMKSPNLVNGQPPVPPTKTDQTIKGAESRLWGKNSPTPAPQTVTPA